MPVASLLALCAFFAHSPRTADYRFAASKANTIACTQPEQPTPVPQPAPSLPSPPVRRIQAGALTLEVFVGSRTAHVFHVVDQISGWSEFCHAQYRRYWEKTYGPLTPEETALLAEHAALRRRRGWGSLEPIFYTPANLDTALANPRLGKDDAALERRVFAAFAPRIERLMTDEGDASERFAQGLEAKRPEIAAFATKAARLFGTKSLRLPVYLLANPDDNSIGGGYNGGVLTLEVPRKRDVFPTFLHEIFHGFIEPHQAALDAAAKGVFGLDAQTLNEGLAYALSPGLFNTGTDNDDPLRRQVRSDFEAGKHLSDSYTRFNRFGLALRPLLKEALNDPHATFATILPRAVDTWRTLAEVSLAIQAPERTRMVSFGPGWEALNTHTWSLGYWLVARSHQENEYKSSVAGYPPGTIMFFLYTPDFPADFRQLPDAYADLLPKPMKEIEAALARGETIETEGKARGFRVILLAAPTKEALSALAAKTKLIGPAPPSTSF